MLVVQVVVVVLGEVMCVLHIRTAAVVHVHYMWLAVLRVVVEDGGKMGDRRWMRVWVRVGVLEWVRQRV